jgi:hypothetical protein
MIQKVHGYRSNGPTFRNFGNREFGYFNERVTYAIAFERLKYAVREWICLDRYGKW